MWHLLTHTAGLTYGFHYAEPLDGVYRDHGFEYGSPKGMDLEACTDAWASLPLLFQPGTEFNYSVATDVLGRVIEVLSGQPLDVFFKERIFDPLGMADTSFGGADPERCAALYNPGLVRNDRMGSAAFGTPRFLSGGGGLVSTATDYHRFTSMLRSRRRTAARKPYAALHGPQPPARRQGAQGGRAADDLRDPERGHGLRPRLLGRARPGAHEDALQRGRAGLGRPRQHRLLGRPEGAHHRAVLHPARPVEHLPAAQPAAPADLRGAADEGQARRRRRLAPGASAPS